MGPPTQLGHPSRKFRTHRLCLSQSIRILAKEHSSSTNADTVDKTATLCQSSAVDSWHARGSTWCWWRADANTSTPLSLRQSPPRHWVMQKRHQLSSWWEKENQEVIGQRQDKAPGGVTSKCGRWAITEMGALGLGIIANQHSSTPLGLARIRSQDVIGQGPNKAPVGVSIKCCG